jgi:tetratricopeptide (TPR) repeat protein
LTGSRGMVQAMSELLNLSVYNPAALSDADFLRSFVARREVAGMLIDRLAETLQTGRTTHQLILGQRGMGKTSMLRRLALAAMEDPRLVGGLIPLSFREEQYNVHSMQVFWANCLDALGDWFEHSKQSAKAELLDREVEALAPGPGASLALFTKWISREGRRPLLLLDNIDLIFAGLKKEIESLHEHIRQPAGILVVGGSAVEVDSVSTPSGLFHDSFEVTRLHRLTKDELIACLRSLALARGKDGDEVRAIVAKDPARIRTLHDLTGGNPRTLTILYLLLERDPKGDVFSDLERLLDQVTVLYKARVEDLPAQARVVLDAVALAWNPVLASEVAATTTLDVTTVSSQLDRLQKEGVIEKVTISKTTKSAFQISERFFNIWYLMRHGPRRQRTRLRWLTVFLRSFYTRAQLLERAKSLITSNRELGVEGEQLLLALSDAIDDEGWRTVLKSSARDEFERYARSLGRNLDEIVDPADLPRPETATEWIRYGDLLRLHLRRAKEAEAAYESAAALEPHNFFAWFSLGALRLSDLADPKGAVAALENALESKADDSPSSYLMGQAFETLGESERAKESYRTCLRLNKSFFPASIALGDLLTSEGKLIEAEREYQLAALLAPASDTDALHASAFFTAYVIEQFDRAIKLYDKLIEIDPSDFIAISNLEVLKYFASAQPTEMQSDSTVIARHPPYGAALIRAIQAMRTGDRATAVSLVGQIFSDQDELVFDSYRGFVLLFLREAARQQWGDLLLRLLDETGASDRHWPLRAAFDALLNGKERLMDVNPEVRSAAQRIFSALVAPVVFRESSSSSEHAETAVNE